MMHSVVELMLSTMNSLSFLHPFFLKKPAEHVSLSNPAPLLVSPEVHLTPAVPSLPATVPAWPSEPTTFGPTG